jgi:hypothetical protein
MNAARRVSAVLLLTAILTGCAHGSSATDPSTPVVGATQTVTPGGGTAKATASTASVVSAPSIEDARTLALRWVASTGELLGMGPIGRSELLRQRVASASVQTMTENLDSDLIKLADGLPIPATELRLVETPLTIDVSIDTVTGQARAQVWSVAVFGAKDLGAPRVVFRTSQLVLVVEVGEWKLAAFTAVEGPTPIATDSLPADWDSFAVVAGWLPAAGGVG